MVDIDDINSVISALPQGQRQVTVASSPATTLRYFAATGWFVKGEMSAGALVSFPNDQWLLVYADRRELTPQVLRRLRPPPSHEEDLPMTEPVVRTVVMPQEIRNAMFALQRRPDDIEYGGGIDFEAVQGRANVERLVAFLGAKASIPGELVRRFTGDMEVVFHTHPNRDTAQPSAADIAFFGQSEAQAAMIVGRDDILVLFKTPQTAIPVSVEKVRAFAADQGFQVQVPATLREELDRFLRRTFALQTQRIARRTTKPVPLSVKIAMERGT